MNKKLKVVTRKHRKKIKKQKQKVRAQSSARQLPAGVDDNQPQETKAPASAEEAKAVPVPDENRDEPQKTAGDEPGLVK